jgi:predicted enzyme related to lactoylglutathione lyase
MIKKIAFVGYPSKDMEAAKKFYGETLGLPVAMDHDKWAEFTTPEGKAICLDGHSPEASKDPGPYLALETDGIEAEVSRLKDAGVTVIKEVWDNKVCKMALVADPNGNVLMLHEIAPDRA